MAFVFADRVKEQTTGIGTGSVLLLGPSLGFVSFATGIGLTNETFYTIVHDTDGSWEVGSGTVGAGSLTRDTVISSSNAGALVNFAAGTKTVFTTAASQHFNGALTSAVHDGIDHTNAPFNLLDSLAHDGIDHTNAPFSLLDTAAHAGIDHTVSPFFLLDTTAHDARDHSAVLNVNPTQVSSPEKTAGTEVALRSFSPDDVATMAGLHGGAKLVQQVFATPVTSSIAVTVTLPFDDTIPQLTETTFIISATITPQSVSNNLLFEFTCNGVATNTTVPVAALFEAPGTSAIAVGPGPEASGTQQIPLALRFYDVPSSSGSPITYSVRVGVTSGGSYTVNGGTGGTWGGISAATFTISEILPA